MESWRKKMPVGRGGGILPPLLCFCMQSSPLWCNWSDTSGKSWNTRGSSCWVCIMVGLHSEAWVPPGLLRSVTGRDWRVLERDQFYFALPKGCTRLKDPEGWEQEDGYSPYSSNTWEKGKPLKPTTPFFCLNSELTQKEVNGSYQVDALYLMGRRSGVN